MTRIQGKIGVCCGLIVQSMAMEIVDMSRILNGGWASLLAMVILLCIAMEMAKQHAHSSDAWRHGAICTGRVTGLKGRATTELFPTGFCNLKSTSNSIWMCSHVLDPLEMRCLIVFYFRLFVPRSKAFKNEENMTIISIQWGIDIGRCVFLERFGIMTASLLVLLFFTRSTTKKSTFVIRRWRVEYSTFSHRLIGYHLTQHIVHGPPGVARNRN